MAFAEQKPGAGDAVQRSAGEGPANTASGSQFLHIGQICVSPKRQSIVLILGSCVAVCIWDPLSAIGGATHYLLPTWDGKGTPSARYGNVAISELLQGLLDAGARRDQLRAKVCGGGRLFETGLKGNANINDLGTRNIEVAAEILAKERIPSDASRVGGNRGKRIVFRTDTGEATVYEL